jgi:FtsZ-binding cell division protein ZapB
MDVSPTSAMVPLPPGAPPNLEGVLSPEHLRTDMELEVLHQETVQKTAQIIDAIRSFDFYALSWVEHNLKECKKCFTKEHARKAQYFKFFTQKNKRAKTGKKKWRARLSLICAVMYGAMLLTMG